VFPFTVLESLLFHARWLIRSRDEEGLTSN
jgi:hypothetical protein